MAKLKDTEVLGTLKATSFIKAGGLSSEFLAADGSTKSTDNFVQIGNVNQSIAGVKTFTGSVIVPDVNISM